MGFKSKRQRRVERRIEERRRARAAEAAEDLIEPEVDEGKIDARLVLVPKLREPEEP